MNIAIVFLIYVSGAAVAESKWVREIDHALGRARLEPAALCSTQTNTSSCIYDEICDLCAGKCLGLCFGGCSGACYEGGFDSSPQCHGFCENGDCYGQCLGGCRNCTTKCRPPLMCRYGEHCMGSCAGHCFGRCSGQCIGLCSGVMSNGSNTSEIHKWTTFYNSYTINQEYAMGYAPVSVVVCGVVRETVLRELVMATVSGATLMTRR